MRADQFKKERAINGTRQIQKRACNEWPQQKQRKEEIIKHGIGNSVQAYEAAGDGATRDHGTAKGERDRAGFHPAYDRTILYNGAADAAGVLSDVSRQ